MQKRLLTFGFSCLSLGLMAQSVGINTDGSAPTTGYLFDVKGQALFQNNLHLNAGFNLGVGTTSPTNPLHVVNSATLGDAAYAARFQAAEGNVGITRYGGIHLDNDNEGTWNGVDWDGSRWQIGQRDGDQLDISHGAPTNTNVPASNTIFRITTGGDIGIGLGDTDPSAKLDVNGIVALNDNALRLRGGGDGNHYLSYLGGSFDGPKLNGNATVVISTNGTLGGDDLVLKNNRIGINTDNPSVGLLHVNGYYDHSFGAFTFYAKESYTNHPNSPTSCCAGNADVSIYATNRMMASEFDALSDARIKDVIGVSNTNTDLNTLLKLKITDYRMKDKKIDFRPYKKVIAQEVREVYPQAVSLHTEVIPDIYAMTNIVNGKVNLKTDLKVGDKVKLILENKEGLYEVIEAHANNFTVNEMLNGDVFVFGKEVNDFHTVDYDAISMLNVSATQELYKIIQAQKEEIEFLKKENGVLKASVESNKADLDLIKTTLNLVGQK